MTETRTRRRAGMGLLVVFCNPYRLTHFNGLSRIGRLGRFRIFFVTGRLAERLAGAVLRVVRLICQTLVIFCDRPALAGFPASRSISLWWNHTDEPPAVDAGTYFVMDTPFDTRARRFKLFPVVRPIVRGTPRKGELVFFSELDKRSVERFAGWEPALRADLRLYYDERFLREVSGGQATLPRYFELKNFVRYLVVREASRRFGKFVTVYGDDWLGVLDNARPSRYDRDYRVHAYGTSRLCLDCGSKSAHSALYPRSIEIVEASGLILQIGCPDNKELLGEDFRASVFGNVDDMLAKLDAVLAMSEERYREFFHGAYRGIDVENNRRRIEAQAESVLCG